MSIFRYLVTVAAILIFNITDLMLLYRPNTEWYDSSFKFDLKLSRNLKLGYLSVLRVQMSIFTPDIHIFYKRMFQKS